MSCSRSEFGRHTERGVATMAIERCQACGRTGDSWKLETAFLDVATVDWQLKLCDECAAKLEYAILATLEDLRLRRAPKGE